jgi:glycosyltransferase involved in cell wall biosynthesis
MKLVMSANRMAAILNSRMLLIRKVRDAGGTVIVATSGGSGLDDGRENFSTVEMRFVRRGFNPFNDLICFLQFCRLYLAEKPDVVHHFHAKPVIYGTLAARLCLGREVLVINTITGIGMSLSGPLRFFSAWGYRLSGKLSSKVVFQNVDDQRLFLDKGYVKPKQSVLIVSSGVDLEKFKPATESTKTAVLMTSRILKSKGIHDYFEAASRLKNEYPNVVFHLAGEIDEMHPDSISLEEVKRLEKETGVEFLGYVSNLKEILNTYSLFVFPSYYREGVPRAALEAAACGIPIIATDAPGVREVLIHEETGLLVKPKDIDDLCRSLRMLLDDEDKRLELGRNARRYAIKRFNIREITERQFRLYQGGAEAKL